MTIHKVSPTLVTAQRCAVATLLTVSTDSTTYGSWHIRVRRRSTAENKTRQIVNGERTLKHWRLINVYRKRWNFGIWENSKQKNQSRHLISKLSVGTENVRGYTYSRLATATIIQKRKPNQNFGLTQTNRIVWKVTKHLTTHRVK
jgi:hypothetical protein